MVPGKVPGIGTGTNFGYPDEIKKKKKAIRMKSE
jgi:hypothetical protein